MLSRVIIEGTATRAEIPGYASAGKTGTTQKVDAQTRTYSKTKRIASFVGFAPADDPYLVIYVAIDEPQNTPYYGGLWAAPVFAKIAEQSLHYLNVPKRPLEVAAKVP